MDGGNTNLKGVQLFGAGHILLMNELKYKRAWTDRFLVPLVILFFTTASVLSINQYHFGVGDQSITIPFLKAFVNSELYPGDYLLGQIPYYYTYLWKALGLGVKHFGADISVLFFVSYFITVYLTFVGVYLIAKTLFGNREVAFLSVFFLLFSKPGLASATTLNSIFLTKVAVLPILLFSIYSFFKGRYMLSFILQGIGFLVHPMTTFYVIAIIFISSIVNLRYIGIKTFLLCITVLIVLASPILVWKVLHSPASLSLLYADPRWIELLELRSPHHIFPLSWGMGAFFQAGLLLCIFLISWKHRPKPDYHRVVITFVLTIFTMCAVGTIFSEFVPLSVVLNLQLLRSFQFLVYFAMIYFANYFFTEIQVRENIFDKLVVAVASIGILYGATGWKYAYVAFLGLAVFLICYHFLYRREFLLSRYFVLALVVIVLILGSGIYLIRGDFSIDNAQEEKWLDVQVWAKQNTSPNDVFIVPPTLMGFRVESERAIYGDWRDGTLMNFNPSFGYEWFRRMEKLGYREGYSFEEGFKNLTEPDFNSIAGETQTGDSKAYKTFLVMFKERDTLKFPIVYGNEKFIVYEIAQ